MKIIIFFAWLLVPTHFIFSQNTIASSGGENTDKGGSASFTIGQLVYTTNIENNNNLAQGVQQAYEFQTSYEANPTFKNYKIVTYPNPTADYIVVEIFENLQSNLNFTLFDIKGKLISSGQITSSQTQIKIQHLANGFYFLQVLTEQQALKTFQIIKI